MGRGLVHPVDLHHSENPPADAELLKLLAREFVAMRYDVKAFLRELAMTRVYQRTSEPPRREPRRRHWRRLPIRGRFAQNGVARATGLERHASTGTGRAGAVAGPREARRPRPQNASYLSIRRQEKALRLTMIEEGVHDQLQKNVASFVRQFAAAPGQPQDATDPTVHQALFLSNGRQIQNWLAPSDSSLVGRLAAVSDAAAIADELYLSVYTRRPTDDERSEVVHYLADRGKERIPALQELAWALLASTEFRFNH